MNNKAILKKGYLVYSSKVLLNIEFSTARTIYMLIEKLRYNNLYLKIDSLFLIKRIPLKLDKRNLSQTISILKNLRHVECLHQKNSYLIILRCVSNYLC